ncbi:hypothetical protein AZSI13_32700 [Azospira sp. I13]|nr:DUF4288 domain-containing protein [Azospira sp. I13]GBG03943.1 hypothetical protein AZSI13_32700 [Azospira sp. I13]
MPNEPWYAAKCVFRHTQLSAKQEEGWVYEERIVLFRASDEDDAIAKAEEEASQYATDGTEYLGFVEVFHLFAESLEDKAEVFSSMRSSKLAPSEYLDHFVDTGAEHVRK